MILVEGLTRRYGTHTAVDDVSFRVEPGSVTGYLGPNGASKSTSMRMIVGLTVPTAGHSRVLGLPYCQLGNQGRHVGVLLDASAQHVGRTGREVLSLGALLMGLPSSRVEEMLRLVGLSPSEGKRRISHYSLGMRQRLGIAHALLGDPQVLILDEPANGLDPAGIRWMRSLLRGFADRGGAVLLSSHLLHEVQQIADELVVIGNGRVVAQGRIETLLAARGVSVRGADATALADALTQAGISFSREPDGWFHTDSSSERVGEAAARTSVVLTELKADNDHGLEDLYLELTGDDTRPHVPEGNAS